MMRYDLVMKSYRFLKNFGRHRRRWGGILFFKSANFCNLVITFREEMFYYMESSEEEISEIETETVCIQSENCQCEECQKQKRKYVSVFDIDRYIASLNDWD